MRDKNKKREYQKAYREKNKERIAEKQKKWREENVEKLREYYAKYRKENAEKYAELNKIWREQNSEEHKAQRAEYRVNNKESIAMRNRRYYEANPEVHILASIRSRCAKLGIPFDLTVEDIHPPTHCPVLGIELARNHKGSKSGPRPNSPAVDRIIPELGYVRGNVLVVSHLANSIKQNATPEQILKVAEFYAKLMKAS